MSDQFVGGTCIQLVINCKSCGVYEMWNSQTQIGSTKFFSGNADLCCGIFFSGSTPRQAFRILEIMGAKGYDTKSYHRMQSQFMIPAINQLYDARTSSAIVKRIGGKPLILSGDGRHDSPGILNFNFNCLNGYVHCC